MAYNLPPAWDPGYALPKYVRQEGLQRRAFVTKQMPRGTYDDPNVKTGGYDVPQYVTDEGYGQGVFTTRWQPSGTYSGPKVPHYLNRRPQVIADTRIQGSGGTQAITMVAPAIGMPANEGQAVSMGAADAFGWLRAILGIGKQRPLPPARQPGGALHGLGGISGDAPMPDPFPSYGQAAATHILARMQTLPTNQRAKFLKKTLATIDPSLEARTGKIARDLRRQGMNSAQALHAGLARAMSAGMVAELTLRGQGKRPSGLSGCTGYTGCSAMGSAAPMAGYRKRAARRGLGATAAIINQGGYTGTATSTSNTVVSPTEITVGPFKFDPAHGSYAVDFSSPNQIPAAARPWILKQLTTPLGDNGAYKNPWPASQLVGSGAPQSNSYYHCGSSGCNAGDPGAQLVNVIYQSPTAADFYAAIGLTPSMTVEGGNATFDMDKITQNSDGTLSYDSNTFTTAPAVKFRSDGSAPLIWDVPPGTTTRGGIRHTSPDDKDWGMWMFITYPNSSTPYTVVQNPDGSTTETYPPAIMRLIFAPLPQDPWWQPLWDLISYIPSKLSDAAGAILNAVGDAVAAVGSLACDVVTAPGAANAAAQGAGKANPVLGAAAGAGTSVASSLCGGTQVPACPAGYMWNGINSCIPIPQPTNWTLIALLGGAGVLAMALAKKQNRKKKQAAAAAGGTAK